MTTPSNQQLRQFIRDSFSDAELDIFCFDYFFDVYDNFAAGMRKNDKVLDVIGYCRRRKLMPNLLVNLEKERKAQFQESFASPEKATTPTSPPKTEPRNPRQIFISYATKDDAELAERLAVDLRASGYPVWVAPNSIHPGEKWADAIERGLQESGLFLLLLTPAAVDSFWVKKEMNAAMRLQARGMMRILPLDVQPCETPLFWGEYQSILFRDAYERGWSRLQLTLEDLPPPQLKPTPRKSVNQPVRRIPSPPKQKPNTLFHEKTGLKFVRIPDGEFLYSEKENRIHLPEYWISKIPVTNMVYKRFIDANPTHRIPKIWLGGKNNWDKGKRAFKPELADHPVVIVSWHDAIAFCKWADLQLPIEEEWEKAARGTDGRKYPWGNNDPTDKLCNFNRNVGRTTSVGKYSPQGDSPYGCIDMSGNVWEWCLNKYETSTDITIDHSDARPVLRGGSFILSRNLVRAASRYNYAPGNHDNYYVGFRVVARCPPSQ